jgi:hypothetical protein
MSPRRFSAWQKLVALAPLLLLAVYLPGETMLRCRIDGLLRPACCCPQEDAPALPGPVVKAQDCCDRELARTERPAFEAARPAGNDLAPPVAMAIAPIAGPVVPAPPSSFDRASQRHGPAREGPPIVLIKHAFLI